MTVIGIDGEKVIRRAPAACRPVFLRAGAGSGGVVRRAEMGGGAEALAGDLERPAAPVDIRITHPVEMMDIAQRDGAA